MYGSVAIVGVGLIGASIGLALKDRNLCQRILGIGRRANSLQLAKDRGAIDEAFSSIGEQLKQVELAIVCAPVDQIPKLVAELRTVLDSTALIVDAGSTKARIVQHCSTPQNGAEFVGCHPLAGSHRSGPAAADPNLFAGRVCVVTPVPTNSHSAIDRARKFWTAIGMRVTQMSPKDHDNVLARTSHLPHVAAFALALAVDPDDLPLAASGFRDTTRLAESRPELWSAIFLENRAPVLDAIQRYIDRVQSVRDAIENQDNTRLENLLADAKRIRDALGN